MNYTTNYHLPQWVKDDRIMMEDFNDAMAGIDAGLTGAGERMDNAEAESQLELAKTRETERVLDRRLFRLMYNHYSMLRSMDPFPRQAGVFYQNPAANADVYNPTPGVLWRDDTAYMSNTDVPESTAEFIAGVKEEQLMQLVKDDLAACKPTIITFTAPAAGEFPISSLTVHYGETFSETKIFYAEWELKNLDTGEVTMKNTLRGELLPNYITYGLPIGIKPVFCSGRYRLTITPLNAPISATVNASVHPTQLKPEFFNAATGRAWRQCCCCQEDYEEAMVILRFRSGGTGGKMAFTWNGEAVQPAMVRKIPLDNGQIVQENIYYKKGDVPRINELYVSFQCGKGSEFWFYDWGAIFS